MKKNYIKNLKNLNKFIENEQNNMNNLELTKRKILEEFEKLILVEKSKIVNLSNIKFLTKYTENKKIFNTILLDSLLRKDYKNQVFEKSSLFLKELIEKYKKDENFYKNYVEKFYILQKMIKLDDIDFIENFFKENYCSFYDKKSYKRFYIYCFVTNKDKDFESVTDLVDKIISETNPKIKTILKKYNIQKIMNIPTNTSKLRSKLINEIKLDFEKVYKIPRHNHYKILKKISKNSVKSLLKTSVGLKYDEIVDENNELEFPINLEGKFLKHSVYICPITKEICVENNCPAMLKCNHVISNKAVEMILSDKDKVKCPFCPKVTNLSEVRIMKI